MESLESETVEGKGTQMLGSGIDRLVPGKDRVESSFDSFDARMQEIVIVVSEETCCLLRL